MDVTTRITNVIEMRIDTILDYLTKNIEALDQKYSIACQQRLVEIYESVNTALSKTKIILPEDSEDNYLETEELFS